MEWLGAILPPLGPTGLAILILHPVPLTILVALLLVWLLARSGLWRKYKRIILAGAGLLYLIDTAIALPRIVYAWRTQDGPVVRERTPLPATLVLVNADCGKECHARLLSGEIKEIILVRTRPWQGSVPSPQRYRVGWSGPEGCPRERERAMNFAAREHLPSNYCPLVEPAEAPAEGLFVVQEHFLVRSSQKAASFTPAYLVDGPPGRTIELMAVEVQRRTRDRVEVLAARRRYSAPGLLGLPPLIGCWARPENVIWILPPGDTGCGLWRWFTGGGGYTWHGDVDWVFAGVFAPQR